MRIETTLHNGKLALALREATDTPDVYRLFHLPLTPGAEGREIEETLLLLRPSAGVVSTLEMREHLEAHRDRIGVGGCHFCHLLGRVTHRVFTSTPSAPPRFAVIAPGVTGEGLARAEQDRLARAAERERRQPKPSQRRGWDAPAEQLF